MMLVGILPFFGILSLLSSQFYANAYTLQNVTLLRKTLFQDYDKISRPKHNQSEPTEVRMCLNIYVIYDVAEVTQSIQMSASLKITWADENLMWTPADYSGIDVGVYPQNDIWKPGVALKNSVEDFKTLGDPSLNVEVTSDGIVTWEPYQIFTSRCTFDITYFPFDKQSCDLVFVTWGYNADHVLIKGPISGDTVDWTDVTSNPEWKINDVTCRTTIHPRPMMIFTLDIERKPSYVVINIILPLLVLLGLNSCVFLLPSDSGEKTSFAVTVFLSFVVFATIVHQTLPPNSDNVCYLTVYIITLVFESSVVTVLAILLIRLAGRSGEPGAFTMKALTCLGCLKTGNSEVEHDVYSLPTDKIQMFKNKVRPIDDPALQNDKDVTKLRNEDFDWKKVAYRLDWLLFVFFLLLNVVITIIFFAGVTQ
ncbi:acetylcholine receptor subunit alpha-1-B-like [Mya arenaria]|uniref:acetylcholine receptor subunit alpha-1-B-like n=1 Tax=Mya arenaria TaxID=6604 RepID=UPI0022E84F41|nr:acetylcholine receptor subunit alpha-1-B-like [Mya arenaria]